MSRGAQLYHLSTREELFAKAVEHLYELIFDEMREKVEQLPVETDRRSIAIDLIWETVNGPLYQAWLELVIASRTDATRAIPFGQSMLVSPNPWRKP